MKKFVTRKLRSGKTRQAQYAARLRADGFMPKTLWLTEIEKDEVNKFIRKLRHGASHGE